MRWNHAQNSSRPIPGEPILLRKPRSFFRLADAPTASNFVRSAAAFRPPPALSGALEILGHAIEYLADEYANDLAGKGPLGSADPRVAAIQTLKGLNRAIYYSGTEVQPAFSRMRRWLQDSRIMGR
jgi:hypothetical protein